MIGRGEIEGVEDGSTSDTPSISEKKRVVPDPAHLAVPEVS